MLFILLISLLLHFIGAILMFISWYKRYKDIWKVEDYGLSFIVSILAGGIFFIGLMLQYILIKIEKLLKGYKN